MLLVWQDSSTHQGVPVYTLSHGFEVALSLQQQVGKDGSEMTADEMSQVFVTSPHHCVLGLNRKHISENIDGRCTKWLLFSSISYNM
jgi:hypothetical protein